MTDAAGGTVVHFVKRYCELSETFVHDIVSETDRLGWQAWIATRAVVNRDAYPFPDQQRILVGSRPRLTRRVAFRATRRPAPERRAGWLEPQIRAVGPTVLHAHFGWMGLDALPVSRSLGVPLLVSFHATDVTVHPHLPEQAPHYRRLLAGLRHATVVSQFVEDALRGLGYQGRIHRVPAGVRLDEFTFRGSRAPEGPVRLLFIGRQVPRKGLDVLLRAMPLIVANTDATLDVIGDGPLIDAHRELADRLGLRGRVTFHGGRPKQDVRAALERADMLVMPSVTLASGEAEGSPVTTKEALAVGVPVVATAHGGIPETIPPQFRDELVAEGDPVALALQVDDLLQRRDEWPERARVGRRWVEQQFDTAMLARRICDIYEDLAAETRAGRRRVALER